jgi:hypothetical protein
MAVLKGKHAKLVDASHNLNDKLKSAPGTDQTIGAAHCQNESTTRGRGGGWLLSRKFSMALPQSSRGKKRRLTVKEISRPLGG